MATVAELVNRGELISFDVGLENFEFAHRRIFGTPEFRDWIDKVLPGMEEGTTGASNTPLEQVDELFFKFTIGEPLSVNRRFRPLLYRGSHSPKHIWEMKTQDVRIFGWFYKMDCFVCAFGESADTVKGEDLYQTMAAKTNYVREHLNLDPPKCVTEGSYENVLSNAD